MSSFSIDMQPIPKGRPRFTRTGHAYTPARTREYERELKARMALGFTETPFKGPVELGMDFHLARPRKTKFMAFPPLDIDNLVKALLDAANGVLYEDDKQVVKIVASKTWQVKGKIVISINEVEIAADEG